MAAITAQGISRRLRAMRASAGDELEGRVSQRINMKKARVQGDRDPHPGMTTALGKVNCAASTAL